MIKTSPGSPLQAPELSPTFLRNSFCSFLRGSLIIVYPRQPGGRVRWRLSHGAPPLLLSAPSSRHPRASPAASPGASSRPRIFPPSSRPFLLRGSKRSRQKSLHSASRAPAPADVRLQTEPEPCKLATVERGKKGKTQPSGCPLLLI